MIIGQDLLGINKYYDTAIRAVRPGEAVGMFLRTFGDARKTLEKMVRSGKFSQIVVHLAPFDKTHRYPIATLRKQVLADSVFCNALAERFSGMIMLSPFCEHNHPAAKMRDLFLEMKKRAPKCSMVNTIWKGEEVDGTITEIHLANSKSLPKKPKNQYTISFDGFGGDGSGDMPDADLDSIMAKYSDAIHIRAWNFRYNGKFGHKDTTDLAKRQNWPSIKYIQGNRATLDPREGAITWKQGLLKPMADDHGDPEPTKDNKLLAILPGVDKSSVDVFDSKGSKIDTLTRYYPDHSGEPKGPRYYSSKYAFEVAEIAKKNTGSNLVRVGVSLLTDCRKRSGRFR